MVVKLKKNDKILMFWIAFIFSVFYFIPVQSEWFVNSVIGGINLLGEYAQEHVLTCVVPALLIAGGIAVLINKKSILKYLGDDAKKHISYLVASVSGAVLAVCSCTILPLFAGIRKRGAGLGPAITFLFSGPAINVAAIFLTMNVLGIKIGIARVIFAIILSILVGLTMTFIFREKAEKGKLLIPDDDDIKVSSRHVVLFFGSLLGILVINGLTINQNYKYAAMIILALLLTFIVAFKFTKEVRNRWLEESWNFSKLILPLLFIGVFIAGFVMPLLPEELITNIVGSNTLIGNIIASIFGAFMYFSTLTEIPIMQAFIERGMHHGPALALLLAGPSLSLPNMLVIRGVLGTKKTAVYVLLVIVYATAAGLIFGRIF